MEHYVTLFDSLYLPQGLALHGSLEAQAGTYTLWVLCVDEDTHDALARLALPHVRLLRLVDVETPELVQIKPSRTRLEYCWTLTPFAPRFVFEADPAVQRVTYVDADLWLLKSPDPIFQEFDASGRHVLITDHAYAPDCDRSATSGQYCVQFMTFTRTGGESVRRWWEERCVEWCFQRQEGGRFGDQKYLDDWPLRFPSQVHVLQNGGWTLAPWNATRFPYGTALTYHFHGLGLLDRDRVHLGAYALPPPLIQYVYEPYLVALRHAVAALRSIGLEPRPHHQSLGRLADIKNVIHYIKAEAWRFNFRHYRTL